MRRPAKVQEAATEASPATVAQFLIGLITQASMEENVSLARTLANARATEGNCP